LLVIFDALCLDRVRAKHTDDTDDTGLAGAALRAPGKVARVETQSTVLVVATAGADDVNALGTDTGVRGLAAQLEGSLLPCKRNCQPHRPLLRAFEQAQNARGQFL